jgi:hypothetical protein
VSVQQGLWAVGDRDERAATEAALLQAAQAGDRAALD